MANRHIQHLRSSAISANKDAAIAVLRNATNGPMTLAKDGEVIFARYGQVWKWEENKWNVVDYTGTETGVIVEHSMPTPAEIATWSDHEKVHVLIRTLEGIVRVSDGETPIRSVSIVADHDDVSNVLDALDYTDTVNTNTVVIGVDQENGLISPTHATLGTDGSILITSDYGDETNPKTITASVVINGAERVLTKIGVSVTNATINTTTGISSNNVGYIMVGNVALTNDSVEPGTMYNVSDTYYRWDGSKYVTTDASHAGELFAAFSLVEMTKEEVSKIDDPNLDRAFRMIDKDGNQIGDYIPIYKDSSLYDVYRGKMTDTLTNMYKFVSGTNAYFVDATNFDLGQDHTNVTLYTKNTGANDDYTQVSGTTGTFEADDNTLTVSGTAYLFDGYGTPWIKKDTKPVVDAAVKPGKTPDDSDFLEGVTPVADKYYHITSSGAYQGKYYTYNTTTGVFTEVEGNQPVVALCYVYQEASEKYKLVQLPITDFLNDLLFGNGLVYNATTKVLSVRNGYGVAFDTNGAVTLSTNVLGGITYSARANNQAADTTFAASLVDNTSVYTLLNGGTVIVSFATESTANAPLYLNVDGTGAKVMVYEDELLLSNMIEKEGTLEFAYDEGDFVLGSTTYSGFYRYVGKIESGTSGLEYVTNTHTASNTNFSADGHGLEIVDSYLTVTINSTEAAYSKRWLKDGDTVIDPTQSPYTGKKFRVATEGNYYGRTYIWSAAHGRYELTTGVTQDIALKIANNMVDEGDGTTEVDATSLLVITTNGLTMKDTWDCETY